MTDAALTSLQEQPASPGPYEVRICKGMPADCCDYGVISLTTGKEVCRVWTEADARMIASALQPSPAREEAEARATAAEAALDKIARGRYDGLEVTHYSAVDCRNIARHHLGRQA